MELVSSTQMLEDARKYKYGVAAINFHSLEMLQPIVGAAEECRAPIILQTTEGTVRHLGLEYIVALVRVAAAKSKIPMALHLDHCRDFNVIVRAVRAGYTSVMIDASLDSFEDNVRKTKEVVRMARAVNVNVEAEIGKVGGVEDELAVDEKDAFLADPGECEEFVRRTGVSTLAPAVGTAHGMYKGLPGIDYPRIREIASRVNIPLVLHGGSGIPDEQLKLCVASGMAKINVATEIRNTFTDAVRQFFTEQPQQKDPRYYMAYAREAVQNLVKKKINICGGPEARAQYQ
ncbi:fructose-bisphosphate aldolase class II [Desulfocucumis palustris]|uniref:Fructose-bisphosphate aldolase class II n=1 Tax=Desulfocucumis palustris TaxID=1898651 RepID=A0A2L2XJ23_9FIRM|nr:class II fructose-bisphosphate aldolase [Desulfocucumis palustris]GBF34266.1 fructose-bisphosphate aldolase class II [Desulfocucumis palustris]